MAPLKLETAIRAFRGSSFAIAILLNRCFESLGRDPHTFVGRFRDEVSDLLRLLWHGNLAGGSLPAVLSLTFTKRLVWTLRPTGRGVAGITGRRAWRAHLHEWWI